MDKVALTQLATDQYNRQSYNRVLMMVEQQINRAADGYLFPVKRITSADSPYSVSINDAILICDTTSGSITINLKPALEWEQKILIVKKLVAANTVTVDGSGAETIDGAATDAFTVIYTAKRYVSQGGAVHIV